MTPGRDQTMTDSFPQAVDELLAFVSQPNGKGIEERIRAISRLGDLYPQQGDIRIIHRLLVCIQTDGTPQVVRHCIGVLARVKAYSAVMVMIDVALGHGIQLYDSANGSGFRESDESLRLRGAAIQALGRMGDDRAIIPLMSLLNNKQENYRLRLAAAESLGKLGDTHALNPLLEILKDERENSVYLKESAAKALGMLGDIRALEPLVDVLESKRSLLDKFKFLKEQVIEAIGRIGKPDHKAVRSLIQVLQDKAPSIRLAAVQALSDLGDPQALEALKNCVADADDDVAIAAIAAVYQIGGQRAVEELLHQENLTQFLRDEIESYIP